MVKPFQPKDYMFKFIKNLCLVFLLAIVSSCAKQRDYVYFQRNHADSSVVKTASYQVPILQSGDIVSISVSAIDPDVVKPFNMGGGIATTSGPAGAAASGANSLHGYLLSQSGTIEFPVLGTITLKGLTSVEATALIKDKLKSYVNNPIVELKILNHTISVLGEVKSPGIFPITNERMTLPQAMALSGDLLISGQRKDVVVLRDVAGVQTETTVDLTSNQLFASQVYYLQNNDIIYVKPTKARVASASQTLQYTSLAIGSLSLLINLINILTR